MVEVKNTLKKKRNQPSYVLLFLTYQMHLYKVDQQTSLQLECCIHALLELPQVSRSQQTSLQMHTSPLYPSSCQEIMLRIPVIREKLI